MGIVARVRSMLGLGGRLGETQFQESRDMSLEESFEERLRNLDIETLKAFQRYTLESAGLPVNEDPDQNDWTAARVRLDSPITTKERTESLVKVRSLAEKQPNVIQSLRLYKSYVLGRGFRVVLKPRDPDERINDKQKKTARQAEESWLEFRMHNRKWWNVKEFGKRTWRDGEQFTFKAKKTEGKSTWPPKATFIDPEEIAKPANATEDTQGVVTKEGDVTEVEHYQRVDRQDGQLLDEIQPNDLFHTKIDCDSSQKRGISRFYPVIWFAKKLMAFLETEVDHRNLQASIVLQRKVKGGPSRASAMLDTLASGTTHHPDGDRRRERFRRGSIVTTNEATELAFTHPDSNFSDAWPLGKAIVMQIAAATGWPYYAVSADSSESNFASQLVQESPVVLMVEDEQDFFRDELMAVYLWVVESAVKAGRITGYSDVERLLEDFIVEFEFPKLVTRDGLKWAQENNIWYMAGGISTAEVSRRAGADPDRMRTERDEEMENGIISDRALAVQANAGSQNQDPAQKQKNQSAATGGNQDGGKTPAGHSDKV